MSYPNALEVAKLSRRLNDFIPHAALSAQRLPLAPELSLYLLEDSYPQHQLSSEQLQKIMNYPAYWCFCWGSGQALARYVLDNAQLLRGKRVLDFGCGSGVAAIAAAVAGAAEVVACDIDEDALQATRLNAALNNVTLAYRGDFFASSDRFDVILVADVLYDRANLPLLAQLLGRADTVLVADSRVKDFQQPGYHHLGRQQATTVPDLCESEEFSQINLYWGTGQIAVSASAPGQ